MFSSKKIYPEEHGELGQTKELVLSQDGETRSAKVQLPSKKILSRTLNMLFPLECTEDETLPTDQNAKQLKTDSMERITEMNYKAQKRTPRQAAIHAKRKIKTSLEIMWGLHFSLSLGVSQLSMSF